MRLLRGIIDVFPCLFGWHDWLPWYHSQGARDVKKMKAIQRRCKRCGKWMSAEYKWPYDENDMWVEE